MTTVSSATNFLRGVRDGHVAAALTVGVGVTFMLYVCCGHRLILALVHVCNRSFLE